MVCTLIYHTSDVKMFKTQVELGVGSFRSRKNSVDFFTVASIDIFWRPFLLKFLGDSLRRERGKLRRHFVFFHGLHLKIENSSRPIRACEKTLRYLKLYYHHNDHFAINISMYLISINALARALFTVTDGNEAGVDLVLVQPCLLYYVNHVFVILNSIF